MQATDEYLELVNDANEVMKVRIDDDLFGAFSPVIGVIVAEGIDNATHRPAIDSLLRAAEAAAQERYAADGALSADPRIRAWRAAYKQLGADSYRASAEALIRRSAKGDVIPAINPLVDLYNAVSIGHALPIGGEDIDAIVGDVRLGYATGAEAFVRLGSDENDAPVPGEVVYADEAGAICRRWNWREAERTKLHAGTRNALLVVDGLESIGRDAVELATRELADLIPGHLGATVRWAVLDRTTRSFS